MASPRPSLNHLRAQSAAAKEHADWAAEQFREARKNLRTWDEIDRTRIEFERARTVAELAKGRVQLALDRAARRAQDEPNKRSTECES